MELIQTKFGFGYSNLNNGLLDVDIICSASNCRLQINQPAEIYIYSLK